MEVEEFVEICELNGLKFNREKISLFEEYVKLLKEFNQKINLISRKETDIWGRHILHCILPLFKVEIESGKLILDLGTGGGLPGIPWAILNETSHFVLLDGTKKKIDALAQIIKELNLKNAVAVWGRAEEISKDENYRAKFDYVICRSVAELKKLVKWSIDFLNPANFHKNFLDKIGEKHYLHSGCLIAFKGGDVRNEIESAIKTKLVSNVEIIDLNFKGEEKVDLEDKKVVLLKLTTKQV